MGILHADAPTLHGGHAVDEPVVLAILGCLEKGVVVLARRKSQTWGGELGGSGGDSVVGSVGRTGDFPRGPVHGQTGEVVAQTAPSHEVAVADVTAAKLELRIIADHRSMLAGRQKTEPDRTGQDRTEAKRCPTNGVGIGEVGSQDGLESALLFRFRTDLLDNGLTESLTHGARDFLGGYGQAVEGEGGKGRGRSVGRSVVLDV